MAGLNGGLKLNCSGLTASFITKVTIHLFVLAGQKELVLASINGKVHGAHMYTFFLPQLSKILHFG